MRHSIGWKQHVDARSGRVKWVAGRVAETTEPLLVLRGSDPEALPTLRRYRALCAQGGDGVADLDITIAEFEKFGETKRRGK